MAIILTIWFKTRVLPNLLYIVGVVILVILTGILLYKTIDKVTGMLGFDTVASLKESLNKEINNKEQLLSVNRSLTNDVAVSDKISKEALKTVVDVNTKVARSKDDYDAIVRKKDKEIQLLLEKQRKLQLAIDSKDHNKPSKHSYNTHKTSSSNADQSEVSKDIARKISTVQITAVWDKYCEVSNNCSGVTS